MSNGGGRRMGGGVWPGFMFAQTMGWSGMVGMLGEYAWQPCSSPRATRTQTPEDNMTAESPLF